MTKTTALKSKSFLSDRVERDAYGARGDRPDNSRRRSASQKGSQTTHVCTRARWNLLRPSSTRTRPAGGTYLTGTTGGEFIKSVVAQQLKLSAQAFVGWSVTRN